MAHGALRQRSQRSSAESLLLRGMKTGNIGKYVNQLIGVGEQWFTAESLIVDLPYVRRPRLRPDPCAG